MNSENSCPTGPASAADHPDLTKSYQILTKSATSETIIFSINFLIEKRSPKWHKIGSQNGPESVPKGLLK